MAISWASPSSSASARSRLRLAISSRALTSSWSIRSSALTPIPLRPRHLEDLVLPLGLRAQEAELAGGGRRQGDHLVGEVDRALGLGGVAERLQAGADDLLEVALADVDDVEHPPGAAEQRVPLDAVAGGLPDPLLRPEAVAEVAAEQAELPELVGDVLADVGHRAVRADDHLVGVLEAGELLGLRQRHHPAAGVLPLGLEVHGAALLEAGEGLLEEVAAPGCRSRG